MTTVRCCCPKARGQQDERLFVAFHRAILPTGFSVNLDQYLGLSQQGQSGLRDQVDHHYFQIFGASVALAGIEALGQAGANVGSGNTTVRLQNGMGTGSANGSSRIIEQMLQRVPTFTVRERTRVKIYISKDLSLGAYDPGFRLDPL
jgi:type IV secretory pathway VirB10-like protein